MIEALPPMLTEDQLFDLLSVRPEFDRTQSGWSNLERLHMLPTLARFMVPMSRHFEVALALDVMLRSGYVGRVPRTPEFAQRYRAIYDRQKQGDVYKVRMDSVQAQLCTLLMGVSGAGKTALVKLWLSQFPQVIYHSETNVYQITYLIIEAPSDGSSIKGICQAILHKMDELIPGAEYSNTYSQGGRAGADTLMRSVAYVLNRHFVGCLVVDEIQNLANAHKGKQTVMTELVSASNDLGLPIFFIGTYKAAKVFGLDFRQSRRPSGRSVRQWHRHKDQEDADGINEWREFLTTLWGFQWLRNFTEFNQEFAELIYEYSQGVIDLAIKLFACAQARAILDGSEAITPELITDVYNHEFELVHPMLDALRKDDFERLARFEDISPPGIDEMVKSISDRLRAKSSNAYRLKPDSPQFEERIVVALVATGFPEDESRSAASAVKAEGKVRNLEQGVAAAKAKLQPIRAIPRAKQSKKSSEDEIKPDFSERPMDYRRAIYQAKEEGTTIYAQMKKLELIRPIDKILELI